ncbi:MAG TPA: hypothetical protein VM753_25240, partial [Anaeromyxobacter sp.]|nr:hypothetical protein [Anaeromyxobacter sp.]
MSPRAMPGASAATDPPLPARPLVPATRPPGAPAVPRDAAPIPGHSLVSELRPGTLLLRADATGALAVLRRAEGPRRALERRLARLARAPAASAAPGALVEAGGALHVLRPFEAGRSLAEVIASRPDPATALRVARALLRSVAALARTGAVHGALHPGNAIVRPGGDVALTDAEDPLDALSPSRAQAVPFAAPEVLRGRPATRASDAFSAGAIVHALLAGRSPFAAGDDVLEAVRRVLHEPAPPLTVLRPGLPPGIAATVQAALAKRPRRRAAVAALLEAIEAATGAPTEVGIESVARRAEARTEITRIVFPSPSPSPSPSPTATSTATPAHEAAHPEPLGSARDELRHAASAAARSRGMALAATAWARLAAALPRSRPRRLLLTSGALVAVALAAVLQRDASVDAEVAALLARGEHAKARAVLERAEARRPGDGRLEKLRGDVACARGAAGECLRRYRLALAARPELRADPTLRANARNLLATAQGCGARRA